MKRITLFLLGTFFSLSALAQNRKLSVAESVFYAVQDPSNPMGYRYLFPETLESLRWFKDSDVYLYAKDGNYLIFNPKGEQIGSINAEQLNGDILLIDKNEIVTKSENTFYRYNSDGKQVLATIALPKGSENAEYDPQAKVVAYTLNNNLYFANSESDKKAITSFTDANIVAGKAIHRNEFGINKGIFFSPKGNYVAFYQKDESKVADYPLVDITTTPATLKSIKYPMAGQPSEQAAVGIYDFQNQKVLYLDIDTTDEHFLTNLAWSPDERYILLAEVNRAQNHFALNRYDARTGKKVNTIFEERNAKWVEPEKPAVFLPNKADEFLWLSERNGFTNVYHYNTNGKLIKQITNFQWVVQDILGFNHISIQAKRYALDNNVARTEVQGFVGAVAGTPSKKGIFITTSDYTKGAMDYVESLNGSPTIILMNGQQLAEYIYDYGLGLQTEKVFKVMKMDMDYWDAMDNA